MIFETTQSNQETTYPEKTFKDEEIDQENDETTITPTSFVTRNTFTPSITTYKPSTKIIQFLPYSPAATTTKSTTTSTTTRPYRPTTTTKVVTDSNQSYEPTPFNFHLDPIARLEKLNRLKNKKYVGKNTWSLNVEKEKNAWSSNVERSWFIRLVRVCNNFGSSGRFVWSRCCRCCS